MQKNQKQKKYEVTRKHCLNHKIGDVIELTDDKARKLSGKVEPFVPKVESEYSEEKVKKFISDAEDAVIEAIERADKAEAELLAETERADKAEAAVEALKKAAESPQAEKKKAKG